MSTPLTGPVVPPLLDDYQPRLFTAADLAAMPSELPSGPVRYELHHGRIITMAPAGDEHGAIENKIAGALLYLGEHPGHGKARCGEVGILLARSPDHLLAADAAFIGNDRLPVQRSPEEYLLTIPHLVVEVRSKNDTLAALGRKAQDYLDAGVLVVWVVDPASRTVHEHRPGQAAVPLEEGRTLTVPDVIPGFTLAVADVFRE